MSLVRHAFRLALLVYFASNAWHPLLRGVGAQARWVALAFLLLAALAAPALAASRRRPLDALSVLPFGALVVLATYSTANGIESELSTLRLASLVLLLVVSALLSGVWSDDSGRRALLRELVFMARVVTYSSLPLLALGINLGRAPGRFSGWLSNPNELGMMLFILAPAVLHVALTRARRGPLSEWALLGGMGVLLLATGSRSAMLGAFAGVTAYLWSIGRLRFSTVVGSAVALTLIIWLVGPALQDVPGLRRFFEDEHQIESVEVSDRKLGSGRGEAWSLGWDLFLERKLGGYGWGVEQDLLAMNEQYLVYHHGRRVHNSYLSLLLQVGVLGAIPVLLLIILGISRGARGAKEVLSVERSNPSASCTTGLLLAMFCAGLVHAVFESWMFAAGNLNSLIFFPVWFMLLRCTGVTPTRGRRNAARASVAGGLNQARAGGAAP